MEMRQQMMRRRGDMEKKRQMQMALNRVRPPMQRQGPMPSREYGQGFGRY
jgi:hypothetical protein